MTKEEVYVILTELFRARETEAEKRSENKRKKTAKERGIVQKRSGEGTKKEAFKDLKKV